MYARCVFLCVFLCRCVALGTLTPSNLGSPDQFFKKEVRTAQMQALFGELTNAEQWMSSEAFFVLCFDVGLANIVIQSFRFKHSYAIASISQFQLRSHGVQAATEHLL